MSHHAFNARFSAIMAELGWGIARAARALCVGEDDVVAWQQGQRATPEGVIVIMEKFQEIHEGGERSESAYDSHAAQPERAQTKRAQPNKSASEEPAPQSEQERASEQRRARRERAGHIARLRHAYDELLVAHAAALERLAAEERSSFGPYATLGVLPGASWHEIRARYHELSKIHHPDRGGDEEQMKRVSLAYTELRFLYDR